MDSRHAELFMLRPAISVKIDYLFVLGGPFDLSYEPLTHAIYTRITQESINDVQLKKRCASVCIKIINYLITRVSYTHHDIHV